MNNFGSLQKVSSYTSQQQIKFNMGKRAFSVDATIILNTLHITVIIIIVAIVVVVVVGVVVVVVVIIIIIIIYIYIFLAALRKSYIVLSVCKQ